MLQLLFKKSGTTELRNLYFFPLTQPLKNDHTSKTHPALIYHLLCFVFLHKYIFLHASATVRSSLSKKRNELNL